MYPVSSRSFLKSFCNLERKYEINGFIIAFILNLKSLQNQNYLQKLSLLLQKLIENKYFLYLKILQRQTNFYFYISYRLGILESKNK